MTATVNGNPWQATGSDTDDRTTMPDRYKVLESRHHKHPGRQYLDDGSNFVAWVDGWTGPQIIARAWEDVDTRRGYVRRYVEALDAGKTGPHAGCDHAYGICTG